MVTDFMKILLKSNGKSHKCEHSYDIVGEINVPLVGGGHTKYVILRCGECGNMSGFPSDNLEMAIKDGTDETKEKLKELGLMKSWKIEEYMYPEVPDDKKKWLRYVTHVDEMLNIILVIFN